MRWRKTLTLLHRDVGFFAVGLTLVYAISGIAVNHRNDFDSNRTSEIETVSVGTPAELLADLPDERCSAIREDTNAMTQEEEVVLVERLTKALGRETLPKNRFWRSPDKLSLHYETGGRDTVEYQLSAGSAVQTKTRDRVLLRDLNFLHLNEGKKAWTFVADGYALLLVFLALSGVVIVRGRRGLKGRGGILLALGVVLPLVAVIVLRYV